ncbi:zf-TFIIB domain-containing protein [Leucobacter luti]|uniref:TFIIB-type zinc ribbon-containing protein n=1 Tax=Leucobacter luti TaxID=340320 RepID=UPI001C68B4B5|nr:zf-TFIIB domain-containing protein [Leucobacter luti]QYM75052.1 zf-TFIIB domain-containing protein [Leucobacter luti]
MNCPSDGTTLLMSERQGIEIDYCPQCRGIWLDRGELDKMLDRAQAEAESFTAQQQAPAPQQVAPPLPPQQQYSQPVPPQQPYVDPRHGQRGYDERRRDGYSSDGRYRDPRYKKKKSPFDFLGDIFE